MIGILLFPVSGVTLIFKSSQSLTHTYIYTHTKHCILNYSVGEEFITEMACLSPHVWDFNCKDSTTSGNCMGAWNHLEVSSLA